MTFENVADFGPGVSQPSVAIIGLDRTLGGRPPRTSSRARRCRAET